jgi:hypothetical protein
MIRPFDEEGFEKSSVRLQSRANCIRRDWVRSVPNRDHIWRIGIEKAVLITA